MAVSAPGFKVLRPDVQIQFWAKFQLLRTQYLSEALSKTVQNLNVLDIDSELAKYVGALRLGALAAYQLRGEVFYPVPCLLRQTPSLLGYYRLLYGVSRKEFYYKGPFGPFQSMEERGKLSTRQDSLLEKLCESLERVMNLIDRIAVDVQQDQPQTLPERRDRRRVGVRRSIRDLDLTLITPAAAQPARHLRCSPLAGSHRITLAVFAGRLSSLGSGLPADPAMDPSALFRGHRG